MEESNGNLEITEQVRTENTVEVELPFLKNLAGWATFKAVIDIILGAISCLGIVTAAYGIPQIIAGIRLLGASDDLKRYMSTNDTRSIGDVLYNFNRYFKLSGISIIVKIVFVFLGIVLYIIILAYVMTYMGDFFNNFPGDFKPF